MHTGVYLGLLLAGLALTSSNAFSQGNNKDSFLDRYQWQKRVILVFIPLGSDSNGQEQLKLLRANPTSLTDRDLVIVEIRGDSLVEENFTSPKGDHLRRQFKVAPGIFTLILIGKDGGEKYRSLQLTSPTKLFTIIDAMPMRQNEINTQRNQKQD